MEDPAGQPVEADATVAREAAFGLTAPEIVGTIARPKSTTTPRAANVPILPIFLIPTFNRNALRRAVESNSSLKARAYRNAHSLDGVLYHSTHQLGWGHRTSAM